jgi:signal transduction histidine kinase
VSIEDDGIGFDPIDPGDLSQQGHYGLLGIHERAALIDADNIIRSEPGKGTTLIIRVPY